jgi:2-polyprenyl-3-methyl-5-hydroxy-6-metoxy-1,4-benzoquinol methylase
MSKTYLKSDHFNGGGSVLASRSSFLDIACGDASTMKSALHGTKVRHYHGIDLSQPALELAPANLAGSPFEVDLDHRDFVEAMMRRPEHADTAWCGLSIHHLSTADKLRLMKAIPRRHRPPRHLPALRADAPRR